ncbi:MAG: GNAT family N-acetyltransferase [Anaerolineae bacterium]|nr:GNAT family N-acetyltransferase [Anaerolineae bacterium]
MSEIQVRRVETPADQRVFFEFPWGHYQDDPHWVPELPSIRRETLDRRKNPAWEYLTGDYYVAWRDGQPVGTIAAFVNHHHNRVYNENIGFFGFFEAVNDPAVARALLQTAEQALRGHGVEAIQGPASFTSNEAYGVLVKGFDAPPMVLMPYNPPYYADLLEGQGFAKVMDLLSWRVDMSNAQRMMYEADGVTESRLVRAIRRNMERRDLTVRTINMQDKRAEFQRLRDLYNVAWDKNWGFLPMTDRELDAIVRTLGLLLMPQYTFFGLVRGELAGFLLVIPNLSEVMQVVRPRPGVPEIWWLLKTAWHFKIRPKVNSVRGILMGVKEEYRGLGVDAALHLRLAEAMLAEGRYAWGEAGWVLETNEETNRLTAHFGGVDHRHHRLYRKTLAPPTATD